MSFRCFTRTEEAKSQWLFLSLLADIFVPYIRMPRDEGLHQLAAFDVIQIDHVHAILSQPVEAACKCAAFTHNQRADAELPHQPAAIPARGKRRHHHQVTVAALASGTAKSVGLAVNAGIALLHAPVAASAEQLAGL